MKLAEERYKLIDAGTVLDVATGRGEFVVVIKNDFKSYEHIVGIDISAPTIKHTQTLFPENNIEILRMSSDNIEFADEHFDTVCISNSLHHLEHRVQAFKEMMRVLKAGGMFIATEMYADGKQSEAQRTHIAMHHWFADVDNLSGIFHEHTYKKQQIIDMLSKLPLLRIETIDYYYPTDNPKDPIVINNLVKNCQTVIKKLSTQEGSENMIAEGEALIERLKTTGFASAHRILFIGKRKKNTLKPEVRNAKSEVPVKKGKTKS
jgi:ubiquinone/menaquinone biosynthesis C-methylase UbiE